MNSTVLRISASIVLIAGMVAGITGQLGAMAVFISVAAFLSTGINRQELRDIRKKLAEQELRQDGDES